VTALIGNVARKSAQSEGQSRAKHEQSSGTGENNAGNKKELPEFAQRIHWQNRRLYSSAISRIIPRG